MSNIKTVGAWGTRSALDDPEETVAGLVAARINFYSQMLNTYRVGNTPAPFRMHSLDKILALNDACREAGIEFSVTSWIMPDRAFIEGAADALLPLISSGIDQESLLIWDAEEVWVRGDGDMTHDAAAALVGELFAGVDMGVTGIVNANTRALRGLTQVCRTWMPQCYVTTRNVPPMKPSTIVDLGLTAWTEKFGTPGRWIIGLAGYYQPDPVSAFMQPPIDDVVAKVGLDSVCYWWHRSIARDQDVTEFIAGVRAAELPPVIAGHGIHQELDIEAMPSGTKSDAVATAQWNLAGFSAYHGVPAAGPGAVDGKPGPNTLAAVRGFQAHAALPETGVVDGATWWALLAGQP